MSDRTPWRDLPYRAQYQTLRVMVSLAKALRESDCPVVGSAVEGIIEDHRATMKPPPQAPGSSVNKPAPVKKQKIRLKLPPVQAGKSKRARRNKR